MNMQRGRSDFTAVALDEEQLFRRAPSIFATQAHESRSAKFSPIPTIEIVRRMAKEGFQPYGAKQSRTRDEGRAGFCKHMIRFRHESQDVNALAVRETFLETVLVNANDGSSSYALFAGLWRKLCQNGMVMGEGTVEEVRVGHRGEVIQNVIEGTYRVVEQARAVLDRPGRWAEIKLEREEQLALARAARALRFGDSEGNVKTPVTADDLLRVRRVDDQSNDLWSTFNVIQENAVKGGLHVVHFDPETQRRRHATTREVRGIDQDVKLNRALWEITQHFASLRQAA